MALSVTYANLLDNFLRNTAPTAPTALYKSYHTANPGPTGASEATNYTRPGITFGAPSGGTMANTNAISVTFTAGAAAQTISFEGLWDAATGGNFIGGGAVTTSKTYNAGDTLTEAVGASTFTLS